MTEDSTAEAAPAPSRDRLELVQVVILACAALLTAWAAFQSTKWGGVQANSYSQPAPSEPSRSEPPTSPTGRR